MIRRHSALAAGLTALLLACAHPVSEVNAVPLPEEASRAEQLIADLLREPDQTRQQQIYDLIIEGERIVYEGSEGGIVSPDYDRAALDSIVDQIEALSGIRHEHSYFIIAHGGDIGHDANFLAAPRATPVNDLTDTEIVALIEALHDNIGDPYLARFMWFLSESLGPAFSSDLIFWPYAEWTTDELVAEYRRRQAIHAVEGAAGLRSFELGIAQALLADPETDPPRQYWAEGVVRAHERRVQADTQAD